MFACINLESRCPESFPCPSDRDYCLCLMFHIEWVITVQHWDWFEECYEDGEDALPSGSKRDSPTVSVVSTFSEASNLYVINHAAITLICNVDQAQERVASTGRKRTLGW